MWKLKYQLNAEKVTRFLTLKLHISSNHPTLLDFDWAHKGGQSSQLWTTGWVSTVSRDALGNINWVEMLASHECSSRQCCKFQFMLQGPFEVQQFDLLIKNRYANSKSTCSYLFHSKSSSKYWLCLQRRPMHWSCRAMHNWINANIQFLHKRTML